MSSWSEVDLRDLIPTFEAALDWEFDVHQFDDRLKMQKLVYFAKNHGLDAPYEYNLYRYGPYSPSLARDYYEIWRPGDACRGADLLDTKSFVNILPSSENSELEIAATID